MSAERGGRCWFEVPPHQHRTEKGEEGFPGKKGDIIRRNLIGIWSTKCIELEKKKKKEEKERCK